MLSKLIAALQNAELEMSAEEIADMLWLASQISSVPGQPSIEQLDISDEMPLDANQLLKEQLPQKMVQPPSTDVHMNPRYSDSGSVSHLTGLPFRSPAASALPNTLSLARALRPLMRRLASKTTFILNENATVQTIAEAQNNIWLPILDPAPVCWFDIALIIDEGSSMLLWKDTIVELRALLEHLGAFRNVRVWKLATDDENSVQLYVETGSTKEQSFTRNPKELIDPSGRRLILVVTDCVSKAWHSGGVQQLLDVWGKKNLVTLIQMLPRRLWHQTALSFANTVRIDSSLQEITNAGIKTLKSLQWFDEEIPFEASLPFPVVTLEPRSLLSWSRIVTGSGGTWITGKVFEKNPAEDLKDHLPVQEEQIISANKRVQLFHANASQIARKLSGLLAVAPVPISLQVIRLIRHTMLPEAGQVHIAEVLLSGLLEEIYRNEAVSDPDHVEYDFIAGVRDELLNAVPIPDGQRVLSEISTFIGQRYGQTRNFLALVTTQEKPEQSATVTSESRPFAQITADVLRRFGGKFASLAENLEQQIKQLDTTDNLIESKKTRTTLENSLTHSQTTIWPIDRQTQAKHEILRRYLEAWFPMLIQHFPSARIVDGFAGPGEYENGQPGSPLIALDVLLKHPNQSVRNATHKGITELIFIEQDARRSKNLEELVRKQKQKLACPPNLQTHILTGTFTVEMERILQVMEHQRADGKTVPTFVFIDPFGYSHTPLNLITRLMSFANCEVLITLMAEEINRFLDVDYRTKEYHYDTLFGTDEWRQITKETTTSTERMNRLRDLYHRQLLNESRARYVRSFRMRNKHNATDYFLFFATNSQKGLLEMKRAMWGVDPTGTFEFSDFSNPYQPLLLTEPNYTDLQQRLSKEFQGRTVSIEVIEEYVLAETPYLTCKKVALAPMEAATPPQIYVHSTDPGYKHKKGDYPALKTLIEFPQTITTRNIHTVKIFFSYAHEDELLKNELAKHLEKARISGWHDRKIEPGTDWENEIDENLETADIVLLLISPDFKASKYCSDKEMTIALAKARENKGYVIPILLRSVYWPDAPYLHLQIANPDEPVTKSSNRDLAFADIATKVGRAIDKILKKQYIQDAEMYIKSTQYENAYAAYKQALSYDSEDAGLSARIGDILFALKRYEEALKAYNEAMRLQPKNDRFLIEKGKLLTSLERHQEALATYQEAIRLQKNDFALYKVLGDTLYILERPDEAQVAYKEAMNLRSDDYQQYMSLGNVFFKHNNYRDALIAYERAEHLQENDAQIYMHKGKTLVALANYDGALAAYEQVSVLNPADPDPYADKVTVFAKLGQYEKALQSCEKAIDLNEKDARLWRDKGDILVQMERLEEALNAYEEAISRAPSNAFFYKSNADALFKLGRYEEALLACDEAIERNTTIGIWYSYRAEIKRKISTKSMDKYRELHESAEEDMRRAKKINNDKNTHKLG